MAAKQHYDPNRSKNQPEVLEAFLRAPISGNLDEVPGIGAVGVDKLAHHGVSSTFQLLAKFLSFKSEGLTQQQVCDQFFHCTSRPLHSSSIICTGLTDVGAPPAYRSSIVEAVARKLELSFPGVIYDATTPEATVEKLEASQSQLMAPAASQADV